MEEPLQNGPRGPRLVLAIDPGRAKCGLALVSPESILLREIVPVAALPARVSELLAQFTPDSLVIGSGTGSGLVIAAIEAICGQTPVALVGEAHTSELARARYLVENRPRGFRRLLPSFLRTPEEPYDDYVAVILAERWLADVR